MTTLARVALMLGAAVSLVACGQVERSPASTTGPAPETNGAIVVLRPEGTRPAGPDAPPTVTLGRRQNAGTLAPLPGEYIDALEFRAGVAAVTRQRELYLMHPNGSRSLLAKQLDGLPALASEGSLFYAARFGEVVELTRLRRNGVQYRLASFRGSATRLSPRSDGTLVFIGSDAGGVAGIWVADSHGARCLTNCELRAGRPWGNAYRPPPGETATVRFVESRIEWKTADGRAEAAPLPASVTP